MFRVGSKSDLPKGKVTQAGKFAVGNNGEYFAVGRTCRHFGANLAQGSIDADGCLVCPWHGAKYDVKTGRMILGPQGIFAKIPGLGPTFKALTRALPLRRGRVVVKDDEIFVDE
ncbi:Rieske (2Fe-2S) protein [Hoyosella subflava]|uniref:Rieske (2Fe-2S) iron-sulfur domain protein n=1 Tax=Hoyosella subflava (strain DSM 45089 / JCM 17490 / NBRC 109087 / DQS3-9A1) TaxID=443218 RepID=F6EKT5_HOYSD|nr:Rieske 2Fe-2S domain-containing protein [Hoyosella subflava]AEF41415.1 Rieske (2Fe-2S) iron-sulfur domain protein [Hoyosella subflava DQS3-9A1]